MLEALPEKVALWGPMMDSDLAQIEWGPEEWELCRERWNVERYRYVRYQRLNIPIRPLDDARGWGSDPSEFQWLKK